MSEKGLNAGFIESLPAALLEKIPAAQPPPGVIPNFDNPATLLSTILPVQFVFLFFAATSYAVRVYMKAIVLKKWQWDDTMISIAFLFTAFYLSSILTGAIYGIIGVHLWDIHVDRAISRPSQYGILMSVIMTTPSLGFIKVAFIIQFYYLFKPLRWLRLCCWFGGGFIAFVYAAIAIVAFALNSPWPGEDLLADVLSWHFEAFTNLSIPTGVLSLVTDLFLLVLPIPAVIGLQMALKKKIGILIVFSLGALAVVGSGTGLYYRVLLWKNINTSQYDPGYWGGYIAVWQQLEILVGITAANMPAVHHFFVRKKISLRLFDTRISAFRSLLSSRRHRGLSQKDDTNSSLSFGNSTQAIEMDTSLGARALDTESNISQSKDQKYGSRLGPSQIMISHDYTITSHAR